MELQELIALLLPVAAASGWIGARQYYLRKSYPHPHAPLTEAYRKGLNYLLDERPEKALAAVERIIEQDQDPFETQVALGNLFRRRGEVEKAIELHEKLMMRPDLTPKHHARASFELGMDYLGAGLFDRAEHFFKSLVNDKHHRGSALQQLLMIYISEREWQNAIHCVDQLTEIAKPRYGESRSQFLCELAEEAMVRHRLKDARDYLNQALVDDPLCVRANMVKGRLELANGEYHQAVLSFKQVEHQNPVYLPIVFEPLKTCWDKLSIDQEATDYLDHLYQDYGLVAAAVEVAERILRTKGTAAAIDYLLPVLEERPEPLTVSCALELLTEGRAIVSDRIEKLGSILTSLIASTTHFHCVECGFSGHELHWCCPTCRHWSSIVPN